MTATREIKGKITKIQEQCQKTSQEIETQQSIFQDLQTNLDLSAQEKSEKINQSLQTIETLKAKLSQSQQDLKTCEQNLQGLLDENRPLVEIFQIVADQFAFVFPFNFLLSADSELVNSPLLGQKSIKNFINNFHNFVQNIPHDNIIDNILSLHNYTHTLTNLLLCFPHQISFFEEQEKGDSFFLTLLASSKSLFQIFFDSYQPILAKKDELIKRHNFFIKLATLLEEAAGISLSYYKARFFNQPQATFPDISKPVLEWIETILKMFSVYQNSFSLVLFDIEALNRNLFATLIGLMQLLQVSDPETAFEEFIKKENSAIRTLLSSKITSPWQQSFSVLLVSFFDDYFRASLTPELEIPQRIKEYLISHTSEKFRLDKLCESVSMIREKEVLCIELLIASLHNHFHFEKLKKDIFLTIDPSKEMTNPASQIQSVLQSLSLNSIQALKLLLDLFIENYLYNLHQLKQTQKITPTTMFKDITSLLNIFAPLLSKYPQFILYLVFQKEDYADFKEITFIECLFKLQFFTFHPDDSLSLIKALLSYTGVLFSQDANTVLDSNILVTNHLLNLLNQELHSKGEHSYLAFGSVMRIFAFIWRTVGETQNQAVQDILDPKILFILKQLLVHLGHHSNIHCLLSLHSQNFDYVFTENLKEWLKKQLIKRKINETDLTEIREQNYKNLLENDLLNSHFDTILIDQLTCQSFHQPMTNGTRKRNHNLDEATDYRKRNYTMRTIDHSFHIDFGFSFAIHKQTNISNDEVLENVKTKQVKRYQILSQNRQDKQLMKNLGAYIKQWSFDINGRWFEKRFPNYLPPRTIKCPHLFSIPKEQSFNFETPAQPFYKIIEENLPSPVQQKSLPPPSETLEKQEVRVIKYFSSNPLIQKSEDFEHAKQVILQKLKILTEQLLLELLYLEQQKDVTRELASKIIIQELTKLPEFDGNLLLCLADQFEPFKLLAIPDCPLEDLKEEFRWITNNLPEYILTMKTLFGENQNQTSNITKPVVVYDGFIFPADFAFCIDKLDIRNKEDAKKLFQQQETTTTCSMIDEIVESMVSLLSGHYIQNGRQSNNHHAREFMIQLCHNSPVIEIKLIDYCLSILYCPHDDSEFLVSNVWAFLEFYFSRVNHLIYLPRILLEKYKLKNRQSYIEKTPNKLSVCDLLIGLLEEGTFLSEVKKILTYIFSKPVNLEIIPIEKGQELEEMYQALGQDSMKVLSKMADEIDNLMINVPDMVFYEYQSITEKMMSKVQEVLPILQNTNQTLNTRLIVNKEKFVPVDIKEILLKRRTQNKTMGNILCGFSCVLSTWNKSNNLKNIQKQREQNLENLLSHLRNNIFNNKQVKDLIVHFFELLKYVSFHERFFKSENMKIRMMELFKICLYYFALQTLIPKSHNEDLDFDLLLKDTPNNYRDILFESFAISSSKELEIQDLVICQTLPQLADLNFKKKFFLNKLKQDQENNNTSYAYYESLRSISIDRKNLLKSTINEICFSTLKELKKPLKVVFINEYGVDAGGLRREFYTIICHELFDPLKGLFMLDENGIALQPSPSSRAIPDRLIYFELAGIILAKAISQEMLVDVTLSNALLKQILSKPPQIPPLISQGQPIGLDELKEMDPALAKNLEWILSNPVDEGLAQSFVYEDTLFGRKSTQELVPNGYGTFITPETKHDFVRKLTEFKMQKEIEQELEAFLKGFHLIIPSSWLILFSPSELQCLISGDVILNVEEMKLHAQYSGYTQDSQLIKWLWEILQDFSQKELSTFLFFVSGSKRIGKNGLANTPIRYRKATGSNIQRLPTAATCSWAIDIPEYESKEDLKQKLLLAIFEGQQNFQLG